jgi:hypothetical protein
MKNKIEEKIIYDIIYIKYIHTTINFFKYIKLTNTLLTCIFFRFSISAFNLFFSNFNSFSRVLILNVASANAFLVPASSFSSFTRLK